MWLTLALRYLTYSSKIFLLHLPAFFWIFILWVLSLYIAGFYSAVVIGYRLSLAQELLKVHAASSVMAVIFFYIIPYFAITPKLNLLIYIFFSYFLLFGWRVLSISLLKKAVGRGALYFIGPREELEELLHTFQYNPYYSNFRVLGAKALEEIKSDKDLDFETIESKAAAGLFAAIVATLPYQINSRLARQVYKAIFKGVEFFDFQEFYESVFHKIPVSLVSEMWFLKNASSPSRAIYDFFKRLVDVLISFTGGFLSLFFYPFIILAIKFDDGGPIFYVPERVGNGGVIFRLFKFRTMRIDAGARWPEKNDPRVTRVGKFLRRASLDELPQLWNVFWGDISLVGPRPDLVDFAEVLRKHIPYYDVRTLIKPGLTGWAQVSQSVAGENPSGVAETRERLAYDIYYIKNRSILLDLAIILKTLRLVLIRMGFIK